jgi:hypothetical protein
MQFHRILMAAAVSASLAGAQERPWSIDPKPTLILGDANQDVLFGAGLVGAIRLNDGRVVVGDRGDYSLRVFSPAGKLIKSLGRNGSGPGEIGYIVRLWRCGDQIVTYDLQNGNRTTVFGTDLALRRSFRFGPAGEGGSSPYTSTCNAAGQFVHHGWETRKDMKPGAFRANVLLWTSGMDTTVHVIGTIPGSERWGVFHEGGGGTRPMPLGKQPVIAIGPDRIYTGAADTYTITMYDLSGKVMGTFSKPSVQLAVTKEDVDLAVEDEAAGKDDAARERVRKSYAAIELPRTIPAYKAMLIDSEGLVWIRDYRRASPTLANWTVFTANGKQVAEVQLPLHLTVSDIGRDYVLGKFIDPVEDIPEIRMYRLRR